MVYLTGMGEIDVVSDMHLFPDKKQILSPLVMEPKAELT
jgi:hypothetical protein